LTLATFIKRVKNSKKDLLNEIARAEQKNLKIYLDEARRLSRGTLAYAEIARLDYVYATRHNGVKVPGDPAIINYHQGKFYFAWHWIEPRFIGGGTVRSILRNDSEVAEWLDAGTRFMISRPFTERIIERCEPERLRNLEIAFDRVFAKWTR
jgi:hypothetical protein